MARPQSRFVCQSCGEAFLRWEGQCRACGGWNTPRRDGRPRAAARGRRVRGRGGAGAGARRPASAAIAEADLPRLPRRHRRARPGPRRRARARVARARRRRAGDRQVDAPAPGRRRARPGPRAGRPRAVRDRRGVARPGPAAGRAARAAGRAVGRGRPGPRRARRRADRRGRPCRAAGASSSSTRSRPRPSTSSTAPAGSVGQVRESALRLMELAKGDGIAVILVGHVTKDGSIAGPKTLEHLVDAVRQPRGRALRGAAAAARDEEPVRLDRRDRRVRDGRDRPARGRRSGARVPRRSRRLGARAASSRRPSRAAGRCSSRSRRWSARPATARPSRTASGLDPNRLEPARSRSSAGAPGSRLGSHDVYANLAGGLSVAEPGARPAARPRPRLVAARPPDRRRARSPIGEVGLLGELRAVAGLERRLREAARLGFERAIVPAAARLASATPCRSTGSRSSRVGDAPRRRSTAALAGRPSRSWRGGPGDARLTVRRVPHRGAGDAGEPPRRPLIRYIRVLGAALGGLVGLALAHRGQRRRAVLRRAERRRLPRRLGRRLDRRRLRDPAVPDGRARRLAHPPRRGAVDRRVRGGRHRAAASGC